MSGALDCVGRVWVGGSWHSHRVTASGDWDGVGVVGISGSGAYTVQWGLESITEELSLV